MIVTQIISRAKEKKKYQNATNSNCYDQSTFSRYYISETIFFHYWKWTVVNIFPIIFSSAKGGKFNTPFLGLKKSFSKNRLNWILYSQNISKKSIFCGVNVKGGFRLEFKEHSLKNIHPPLRALLLIYSSSTPQHSTSRPVVAQIRSRIWITKRNRCEPTIFTTFEFKTTVEKKIILRRTKNKMDDYF